MPKSDYTEISDEEAKAFLNSCEGKWAQPPNANHFLVLHQGKWKRLGRTDYADNIATWMDQTSERSYWKDPIKYYLERMSHHGGARYTEDGFFVIDAGTDG